jgi:hypothetical protein
MDIKFSVNTPNVAHESIDGEVVVINLISGNYYSLEGTGAEIWDMIDRGYSSLKITSIFSAKYTSEDLNISETLNGFFYELEHENLIVTTTQDLEEQKIDRSVNLECTTFIAPKIDRYSDMQELLLLDPIHDVDAAGWPKTTTV